MKFFLKRKRLTFVTLGLGFCLFYFFSLPQKLFHDPFSTVLEDRMGQLLSASVAADGQWRFPDAVTVNPRFTKAITSFEDKRFGFHPGVDLFAMGRAFQQNIRAGHVISGGSTLTMQVIRLSKKNPPRTVFQKMIEVILATRLELRYSKSEILALYASHAPFGGNVVGIEAACWRYFGRNSVELSWGEAALLAVLPNNPSLIHLARNRDRLKEKRDHLLYRLLQQGELEELDFQLAKAESIPDRPQAIPQQAPHLLDRVTQEGFEQQVMRSTLDQSLQQLVQQSVDDHYERMRNNQIFNAAALVLDVQTGQTLAYVGNSKSGIDHHERVDIIRSPRSTGSILKPFLFAALLDEGKILPKTLMPDVPTLMGGFAPKNFSKQYDGAVPASEALIRSLNVPSVYELRAYRYEKFYTLLKSLGMTTLTQPADHYGLSLVLGGAEGTLWDITGMYASAARVLTRYFDRPGKNKYTKEDIHPPLYKNLADGHAVAPEASGPCNAASFWITFETLKELYRPGEETGWRHFNSSRSIAWKTGTSFGFRDGWAIGVTPRYAVGVWVGNADGEGRPGLTGTEAAAPLLFEIFSRLPSHEWFQKPTSELIKIPTCALSGQRASSLCDKIDELAIPLSGLSSAICSYHQQVHLSKDGKYRVHGDCVSLEQMETVGWFILPPIQEYYFKARNLSYHSLPPYRRDCIDPASFAGMDLIYPKLKAKIYVPVQLDGHESRAVFQATHRNPRAVIYWHLDGQFMASTQKTHRLSLSPSNGQHVLTLVDDVGETLRREFEVISR